MEVNTVTNIWEVCVHWEYFFFVVVVANNVKVTLILHTAHSENDMNIIVDKAQHSLKS